MNSNKDLQHQLGCLITDIQGHIASFVTITDKDNQDIATNVAKMLMQTSQVLEDFYDDIDEDA